MNVRSPFAGVLVLSLLFAMVPPQQVSAFAATDPNIYRRLNIPNFRRPVGSLERYKRNKRSLGRRGYDDGFTTGSGSDTNFERRAQYLREAQLRRIQEDVEARPFTGVRRRGRHFWDRENRSGETTLRRINEARDGGGIRLRRGTASIHQLHGLTAEEKRQRIREYREEVRQAEINRYSPENLGDCSGIIRRRQARCLYELRN